jgi:hypothetical protein
VGMSAQRICIVRACKLGGGFHNCQAELKAAEVRSLGSDEFATWAAHSVHMRDKLHMPADHKPWTGELHAELRGVPVSDRQREVLDIAWFSAMHAKENKGKDRKELAANLWATPSASVQRKPWGKQPGTLTSGSEIYSFAADSVLSGMSNLRLMGHAEAEGPIGVFSETELRDLAGSGVSVPLYSQILLVLISNPYAPWWRNLVAPEQRVVIDLDGSELVEPESGSSQ